MAKVTLRQRIARLIAGPAAEPKKASARMYHSAKGGRLTAGWGNATTSADSEIGSSLATLRARSRALVRDNSYAKRARNIVVNNVIGPGIGLQAQVMSTRGNMAERINNGIEAAWAEWSRPETCHTGGTLHFCDLERMLMAQVFEAGEVFVRLRRRPFGEGTVPLSLEVIEAERLADDFSVPVVGNTTGNVRMGIECDTFGRPVWYWVRQLHASDISHRIDGNSNQLERVPAADMLHLRIVERWPQTRGVPWLHTAMRRLNDMDGYAEAEIVAARASANIVGFIKSPELPTPDSEEQGGQRDMAMEPGMVEHLAPGEDFVGFNPSRPNPAMDPFMRLMLREVAAGAEVSYEAISRDYSQSNYSSSRLSLLDDRDTWRSLQRWLIRSFRERLHREWLQAAVLSRSIPEISVGEYALNPVKFQAVAFKPRGWTWVDPTKEVAAYKEAILAGMTTLTDVIAATSGGADIEDVIQTRKRELQLLDEAGIEVDTTYTQPAPVAPPAPQPEPDADDTEGGTADTSRRRVVSIARTA